MWQATLVFRPVRCAFPFGRFRSFSQESLKDQRKRAGMNFAHTKTTNMQLLENINQQHAPVTIAIKQAASRQSFKDAFAHFRAAKKPDTILYCAIIDAAAELRHTEEGMALFQEMKDHGIEIHTGTYTSVLKLFKSSCNYAGAKTLFEEALRNDFGASKQQSLLTTLLDVAAVCGD